MATRKERIATMERELFQADDGQDPRTRTRTIPMEILNLSFMRTGTMTMNTALTILGYKCYHPGTHVYSHIRDVDMWIDALNAKYTGQGKQFTRKEWDQLLSDASALSTDGPANCFPAELVEAYPEAKVVLVERDIDSWFASYNAGIVGSVHNWFNNFVADLDPGFTGRMRNVAKLWTLYWMKAKTADEHRAHAKDIYKRHYATVRRVTPKERLLEFRLEQGWEPLCQFLNKPIPDVPFPHVNHSEALWDMIGIIMKKGLIRFTKRAALWGLPAVSTAGLAYYMYIN